MNYDEKSLLARTGDTSKKAAALRLRAARLAIGLSQAELGEAAKITKAAINNAEAALSHPSRNVLIKLYREHRIDLNFMVCGEFSQLPGDVQDRLFETLSKLNSAEGRKQD
jgi:transcriptional regulator with XRE-family HTH domain